MRPPTLRGSSREKAWLWDLVGTGALTAVYLFVSPLAGNGP